MNEVNAQFVKICAICGYENHAEGGTIDVNRVPIIATRAQILVSKRVINT